MNGFELQEELYAKLEEANRAVSEMREAGRSKARAEAQYRTAKADRILKLKESGKYPATLITDLAKGTPRVADLKFAFDCAEVEYDVCREVVMLLKRETDVIREQMQREWTQCR